MDVLNLPILQWLAQHPGVAQSLVFFFSFIEALAVIGTFIPAGAALFVAGLMIGAGDLGLWTTLGVAVMGAIAGDGMSFWIGHRYHESILKRWPFVRYPNLMTGGRAYFERHGGKSVLFGRFIAPVRAIVPVIAGMMRMSPVRFYVMNVLSALAWAPAHILPGVIFGASLRLASEVTKRLGMLITLVVIGFWLSYLVLRWMLRKGMPLLHSYRERCLDWARKCPGTLGHYLSLLLDTSQPAAIILAEYAFIILASGAFLGWIVSQLGPTSYLAYFDLSIHTLLQDLRTPWMDGWMSRITTLGDTETIWLIVIVVAAWLLLRGQWRTGCYWLASAGVIQLLVSILRVTFGRPHTREFAEIGTYTFPSSHVAMPAAVLGLLAFFATRHCSSGIRMTAGMSVGFLTLSIAFSQVYLGAHWGTDVLAGMSLGFAWAGLVATVYTCHLKEEGNSYGLLPLAGVLLGSLLIYQLSLEDPGKAGRYVYHDATKTVPLVSWRQGGYTTLPVARMDIVGQLEEPFVLQWAATSDEITALLLAHGWKLSPSPKVQDYLMVFAPRPAMAQMPVLPKLHQGRPQQFALVRPTGAPDERLVLRFWISEYAVVGQGLQRPLFLASLTRERLEQSSQLLTWPAAVTTPPGWAAQILPQLVPPASLEARIYARPRGERSGLWLVSPGISEDTGSKIPAINAQQGVKANAV